MKVESRTAPAQNQGLAWLKRAGVRAIVAFAYGVVATLCIANSFDVDKAGEELVHAFNQGSLDVAFEIATRLSTERELLLGISPREDQGVFSHISWLLYSFAVLLQSFPGLVNSL